MGEETYHDLAARIDILEFRQVAAELFTLETVEDLVREVPLLNPLEFSPDHALGRTACMRQPRHGHDPDEARFIERLAADHGPHQAPLDH